MNFPTPNPEAPSNSTLVVSNAYDHQSRRVLKITPTATHTYFYDGWNLIQETIATATGVTTNQYIWGKDLSGSLQGAGGVGGLLAVSMDGAWYFPFYDNNGNITAYADETGTIVAEYTYDAFGRTIASSGPLASAFQYRFSTKYFDHETCLYYYGYRFYSPELMRWLNRDPIEERGGIALYEFVHNVPLQAIDSLGKNTFLLTGNATVDPPGKCGSFNIDRSFAVSSGAVGGYVIQLMSMRFSAYSCKTKQLITGLSTQGPVKYYEAFDFSGKKETTLAYSQL